MHTRIKNNASHDKTARRTPQKRVSAATKTQHNKSPKNTKKESHISCTTSTQKQQRSKTAW